MTGSCPFCKEEYQQIRTHMAQKHSDWVDLYEKSNGDVKTAANARSTPDSTSDTRAPKAPSAQKQLPSMSRLEEMREKINLMTEIAMLKQLQQTNNNPQSNTIKDTLELMKAAKQYLVTDNASDGANWGGVLETVLEKAADIGSEWIALKKSEKGLPDPPSLEKQAEDLISIDPPEVE